MKKKVNPVSIYQIKIGERIDFSLADWMEDITVIPQENGETLLIGKFVDQAELRGFLDYLWNFNFTIISIERTPNESPE